MIVDAFENRIHLKNIHIEPHTMGGDDYILGRNFRASARLHFQHHLWSETFGYHLNPSIPTDQKDLSIADMGSGTGIWLLELERRLPSPAARLCGLDISSDQFPRPEWLPPNARFIEADAFDPAGPPADLVGAFDIVHLRLFIAIISNDDPSPVLDFCYKLLKPGGFMQWDDLDVSKTQIGSYKGSPTEAMETMMRMAKTQTGIHSTAWIARLPQIFQERGFQTVDVDSRVILPWQRAMHVDNYCTGTDEVVQRAEQAGESVDDHFKHLPAKVRAECRLGSYIDFTLQIVVGRRIQGSDQ